MAPKSLSDIISVATRRYFSRNKNNISLVRVDKIILFTITEWNKLDLSIWNPARLNIFKGRLLQSVKTLENSVYTCHNLIRIKYLTRLRLGFSLFRYHTFKHDI